MKPPPFPCPRCLPPDMNPPTPQLEDIITEDGILCLIISSLPLREAVRTCVLSHRWRHIWTHLPILEFDYTNMFDAHTVHILDHDTTLTSKEKADLLEGKTDQFIQSVNSVLQHHPERLSQFRVWYFLHKAHTHHLDSWVRFAAASKVRLLAILLLEYDFTNSENDLYVFPFQLLGSSSIEVLLICSSSLKPPCNFDGLNHLKELVLGYIDVTEEDMNCLLSNCPKLQILSVSMLRQLVSLSIPCPLSELQLLRVIDCDKLRKIEMNSVNLGILQYKGAPLDMRLRHSVQLRVAEIRFETSGGTDNMDQCLTKLASNLPHLRYLKFNISGVLPEVAPDLPQVSYKFIHLKRLVCEWNVNVKMSLLHLTTLLDAAPFLQELKLRLLKRVVEQPPQTLSSLRETLPKPPRTHLKIKTIEVSEFYGDKWQIEIALYLLMDAIELEVMTVVKGCKPSMAVHETSIENLRKQVPANVKLEIL